MYNRPSFACSSAWAMISREIPLTLMSICSAVMPLRVPATLKSMSPSWSSMPAMSERMATSLACSPVTRPIATPATADWSGTPACIMASEPPHTEAIDDEPFDSRMSLTMRIVYANSSCGGSIGASARRARLPWPISRRAGPRMNFTSPTENGGDDLRLQCLGRGVAFVLAQGLHGRLEGVAMLAHQLRHQLLGELRGEGDFELRLSGFGAQFELQRAEAADFVVRGFEGVED